VENNAKKSKQAKPTISLAKLRYSVTFCEVSSRLLSFPNANTHKCVPAHNTRPYEVNKVSLNY